MTIKTVMVYSLDNDTKSMEPLGILVERRKKERGDNITGMVHLARKEFDGTEDNSSRITVGDYVTAEPVLEYSTEHSPHPESHFKRRKKR
ncbi:MAG: hypothetical protein HW408_586 [Actinobacteria bacterium]|nr:hypothetical protein [Actinomycetota bacterium]